MNDRRKKGLEKEISRIIGMTILTEVKNEKIKNLVTIHKTELTKDGRYLDLTFSYKDQTKYCILFDLIKAQSHLVYKRQLEHLQMYLYHLSLIHI